MIVTCDATCNMGYIYLIPRKEDYTEKENYQIYEERYVLDGSEIVPSLLQMEYTGQTYNETRSELDLMEEYQNDTTDNGYMSGIELNLSYDDLIKRIKGDAFRTYSINWLDDNYYLQTLDKHEEVFNKDNYICTMNAEEDTFLIIAKKSKERLTIDLQEKTKREYTEDIVLIEGLITQRNDLYPLKYLGSLQCRIANRSHMGSLAEQIKSFNYNKE